MCIRKIKLCRKGLNVAQLRGQLINPCDNVLLISFGVTSRKYPHNSIGFLINVQAF